MRLPDQFLNEVKFLCLLVCFYSPCYSVYKSTLLLLSSLLLLIDPLSLLLMFLEYHQKPYIIVIITIIISISVLIIIIDITIFVRYPFLFSMLLWLSS